MQGLNRSLPPSAQLPDTVLSKTTANAVRGLSDSISSLLDVKLTLTAGVGKLALTVEAARSVLSDTEARNVRCELEANSNTMYAFAVREDRERSKALDPKRPRPNPDKNGATNGRPARRGLGDKLNSKSGRQKAKKESTSDTRAALASASAEPESDDQMRVDSALGALFAQGSPCGDIDFTTDALLGKALCVHTDNTGAVVAPTNLANASLSPAANAADNYGDSPACLPTES
eukprot:208646-Pleurochrysis_carterae.AAC.1